MDTFYKVYCVLRTGVLRTQYCAQLSRNRVTPITAGIPHQASNYYSRGFCGVLF